MTCARGVSAAEVVYRAGPFVILRTPWKEASLFEVAEARDDTAAELRSLGAWPSLESARHNLDALLAQGPARNCRDSARIRPQN